jgi:FKBP-type peptidyl-prolyl cis-trans isomerase FklB
MRLIPLAIVAMLFTGTLFTSCGLIGKQSKTATEAEQPIFSTFMDSVSYIIGAEIGSSFRNNQIDISTRALVKGMQDAMQEADTLFSEATNESVMMAFQRRLQMAEMEKLEKQSAGNRQEQETYMTMNAKDPTVMETPSGIQYRVITMGTGMKPLATDTVQVHYEGRFADGETFDASRMHSMEPVEFPLNRVISGWTEAVQLMPVGSVFELVIPADMAYGERGNDRIPPAKMLIFTVELVGIKR